ncbi:DNA-binding response OmpR family regulator [Paraburkholderia sp. GAS33]|uniref:response regulator transcription factor n=1 Tax=Paraburkholderia sp. GAS33 TaxID=3035130 RepID=UPI003D209E76
MDRAVTKSRPDGRIRQAHGSKQSGKRAMRIGILDGDPAHSMLIAPALTRTDYSYFFFTDRKMFASHFWQNSTDLLVINWEILNPEASETVRWIREHLSAVLPILFLAARTDNSDVSSILDAGADDYLEKPLQTRVFVARINTLLRRTPPQMLHAGRERFGIYEFDLVTGQVRFGDHRICLTLKEFELALQFFRKPSEPLSRPHLFKTIWKKDEAAHS